MNKNKTKNMREFFNFGLQKKKKKNTQKKLKKKFQIIL